MTDPVGSMLRMVDPIRTGQILKPATERKHHVKGTEADQIQLRRFHPSTASRGGSSSGVLRPRPRGHALSHPGAPQSQDLPGLDSGGCSCGPGVTFETCNCLWGRLITRMLRVGYQSKGLMAAREMPELMSVASWTMSRRRRELLQLIASDWTGTVTDFLAVHQLTRARYDALGLKIGGR